MGAVQILGPDGNALPTTGRDLGRRMAAGLPAAHRGSYYEGASTTHPDVHNWRPANPSAQSALSFERDILASRIHDVARNDGWGSVAMDRQVDDIIGAGWRLSAKPNWKRLGITADQAAELAIEIEAAYKDYCADFRSCDAGQRLHVGLQDALAFRHRVADGEAFTLSLWLDRGEEWCTAMMVIDPDRVSNPNLVFDQASRKGGVDLGPWGEPLAYHIRSAHPGDYGVIGAFPWKWDRIPRFYSNGRWSVVHAFEPKRAGQVRGEPPLAPIIKKLHMITRYDQAELQAAALNAVLAATVSSPNDHEQLAASMGDTSGGKDVALSGLQDARLGFYEQRGLDMPGVRVNYLFPEDKLELTRPGHPNPAFEAFERVALRNVAASAGLSYEQMTGDFSQSNYSSFRGALLEVWRGFTARKDNWASLYKGPHYSNWLEEAFELGHINYPKGAPRFRDARAAYTAAVWIGPARGQVDEVKESNAALIRIAGGLSTYEAECAQMGKDHLEVFDERARERAEMKKRGLDPDSLLRPKLPFGTQPGAQQPAAPEDQHPEPQGGNPDDEGASV